MARRIHTTRLEELARTDSSLRKMLDEAVEARKAAKWIRGMIANEFKIELTEKEVVAYLAARLARPRRRLEDPGAAIEIGAQASDPGRDAVSETAPSGPAGQVLSPEIMEVVHQKMRQLMRQAKDDPSSDANTIMEIMLVSAMVNSRLKLEETEVMKLYEAQRKIGELENKNNKLQIERYNAETAAHEAETKRIVAEAQAKRIETEVEGVRQELEGAQKAQADGKPWDPAEVVKKISAAIGMGGGLVERIEPGATA